MSNAFDLTDILEKDEVEYIYKRELTEKEWEQICFNLRSRFWSKVRKEMQTAIEDAPEYFLRQN